MHRAALVLMPLIGLATACTQPPSSATQGEDTKASKPSTTAEPAYKAPPPAKPKPQPEIVRTELVAEELPPVPTLASRDIEPSKRGQFTWPGGRDELAPRAVVAVRDGLMFAGQTYQARQPGRPSPSWRWRAMVPITGAPTTYEEGPGAVRAAIAGPDGGALLAGTTGSTEDPRGWFAIVDAHGALELQVDLDSPSMTELFDLIPGRSDAELAVVAGYVDAQGWVVSLDRGGAQRWQKFIGSYGYTQVRALTRLDDQLLVLGTRAEAFGESWWARVPANGGADASATDVVQDKLVIDGADPHQMLRAVVSLGEAGSIALGTAKRNYIQAHDQLVVVGFDRAGAATWSKALTDVRVTEIWGGRVDEGVARFVVGVPNHEAGKPPALAVLEVHADGGTTATQLGDSEGWLAAGFVEGSPTPTLISYAHSGVGIEWRRIDL